MSVPCLERFLEQPDAYREELLPEGALLVAVEAGAGGSFWRVIGNRGFVYGIERFGASAPEGRIGNPLAPSRSLRSRGLFSTRVSPPSQLGAEYTTRDPVLSSHSVLDTHTPPVIECGRQNESPV